MKPGRLLRTSLVALSPDNAYGGMLPLGYLKAYAGSRPGSGPERCPITIQEHVLGARPAAAIAESILEGKPDLVGFSCYFWNAGTIGELVPLLRAASPRLRVVLGGPEVSADPGRWLTSHDADFVVFGEGEAAFAELLRRLCAGLPAQDILGLAARGGSRAAVNAPRPPIAELDSIPSPYLQGIIRFADFAFDGGVIETTRGCPFSCAFCAWLGTRGRMRYFSEARVRAEIRAIAAQTRGTRLFVADADLFMNRTRAKAILKAFHEEDPGGVLQFHFETNYGYMDAELARLCNRSGFLFRGALESTTPEALRAANRVFSVERFGAGIRLLQRHAPLCTVGVELMLGMPGDTLDGFRRSLDWTLRTAADEVYVYRLAVLPGTTYHRESARHGLRWDPEPPHWVLATATFSEADLLEARKLLQRVAFVFNLWALRAVLEGMQGRLDEAGTGPTEACRELTDAVAAGRPFERGFAEWNRGRSEGVFLPSGNWNTDELPVPRRIAALKAARRWALSRLKERDPVLAGAAARFLDAAAGRARWEAASRGTEIAEFLNQDRGEPLPPGGTLLLCWARDRELLVRRRDVQGLVLLSEDKHDLDPGLLRSPLVKDAVRVGLRPRSLVRPERWGQGYSRILAANIYSYLPGQEAVPWLAVLRRACPAGARLMILDSLQGRYPLEVAAEPERTRRERLAGLRKDLLSAGWTIRTAPRTVSRAGGIPWTLVECRGPGAAVPGAAPSSSRGGGRAS